MTFDLSYIKSGLKILIEGDENNPVCEISDEEVFEYGEAKIQLKEACI